MGRGKTTQERLDNRYFQARSRHGLSVADLAAHLGCDRSLIYKFERGVLQPTGEMSNKLNSALGLGVADAVAAQKVDSLPNYLNSSAEQFISLLRTSQIPDKMPSLSLCKLSGKHFSLMSQDDLHYTIGTLIKNELCNSHPTIVMLWTGRNYELYSDFYRNLYRQYLIPACKTYAKVTHLLRDGASPKEKFDLIMFVARHILAIRSTDLYRAKVVSNISIQNYTHDLYFTERSGCLMAMTGASFAEPSIGMWTNTRKKLFKRYIELIDSNSEERVRYFPKKERPQFFRQYLTTESRAGDWCMFQKLPTNSTRPLSDYTEGGPWGIRTRAVEKLLGGPKLKDIIENRRTSTELFLDRLQTNKFRQIMSRQAMESWLRSGVRHDLKGLDCDVDLQETVEERRGRVKNIIDLMDATDNFQIAITDEDNLETIGFGDSSHNISWVVQSVQATVFEGSEFTGTDKALSEFHLIVRDTEFNSQMRQSFDLVWKNLPYKDANRRDTREYLASRLRDIK